MRVDLRGLWLGSVRGVEMLDQRVVPVLGRMEQDSIRLHHETQNSTQLKAYELFISGLFYLIFSDHG